MIYFDNAATGGFKPNSVTDAAQTVLKFLLANPSRSGHRLANVGLDRIYKTRKLISDVFGNGSIDRVVFTKNCTEALNIGILGSIKKQSHVITTVFEHNSVLRPLFELKKQNKIELTVVSPHLSYITPQDIEPHLQDNTSLVALNHGSNVTGAIADINGIGKLLVGRNTTFLVDAAQTGGHIKIDMHNDYIDVLCLAGHKGLNGIMGSGILIFNEKTELTPIMFGGTGSDSLSPFQPEYYPDRLESGTLNLPAICALFEGVLYAKDNLEYSGDTLFNMSANLIELLNKIPDISIFSEPNPLGIISFSVRNLPSVFVAEILNDKYDIAVRGGYHCAPLAHKFLKTDVDGLVRVSLSTQNTYREIKTFVEALKEIIQSE